MTRHANCKPAWAPLFVFNELKVDRAMARRDLLACLVYISARGVGGAGLEEGLVFVFGGSRGEGSIDTSKIKWRRAHHHPFLF